MMLSKINLIGLMVVMFVFCVAGACSAQYTCEQVISHEPDRTSSYVNPPIFNSPVGAIAGDSVMIDDFDTVGQEERKDTFHKVFCTETWNLELTQTSMISYYSISKTPTTTGTDTCLVIIDDDCKYGDDDPISETHIYHIVGPTDLYGPSRWCKNMSVQMCATYYPDGTEVNDRIVHANYLQWYWKVQGAADSTYTNFAGLCSNEDGTKSVCSPSFSTPGKYTICVKAQRYIFGTWSLDPSGWDNIVTKDVEVIGPEDVKCDSSGIGGCDTGYCIASVPQFPSPDLKESNISSSYNPNGPGSAFLIDVEKCPIKPILKMFRFVNCNTGAITRHWHYTDPCGKTFCVDFTTDTFNLSAFITIIRSGNIDAWTYIVADDAGNKYFFGVAPVVDGESTAPYLKSVDADGNIVEGSTGPTGGGNSALMSENPNGRFSMLSTSQTLTVVERNPDESVRETWTYDLSEDNERVIKETHPDGTIVDITYEDEKPIQVNISNSPTNLNSQINYVYTDGKLTSATKGSKKILYAYDTDKITITEKDTNSNTIFSVIEFTYGIDITTVRRIYDVYNIEEQSEEDRSTIYKYFLSALGKKSYLYSVTDPLGRVTKNCTYVPTGTTLSGGELNTDYIIVSDTDCLKGKVFKKIDAVNRETSCEYNSNGLLTIITYPSVIVYNPNQQTITPTTTYSYYGDSQNPISFIKTIKDNNGIYTHYERNPNAMHQVTAIKVDNADHTDLDWGNLTSIKEYEYYGEFYEVNQEQVLDPRKGKLLSEKVPNIESTINNIKTYDYFYNETKDQETTQKVSTSPTKSYYQVWNGTTYDTVSGTYSVDIGTNYRKVTATDAIGRHIVNITNKDELTHERTNSTIYAEDKFTMAVYDCCNLLSTVDEDGREIYYEHDAIGRITKTWTEVIGQSEETPLVAYTYDNFGNTSIVTTSSDVNITRVTSYTFDKLNRVTNIVYPEPLGDEVFGYDTAGNIWYKSDGNNIKNLYQYDNLNRLIKVYYNYTGTLGPNDTPNYTGLTASVEYQYRNGGSQLYRIIDSSSGTTYNTDYTYDSKGRLESCTSPNISNRIVSYTYNNLGQKTSVTNGDFVVNYEYYANGWLKNVKKGIDLIAKYEYDNVGNRTNLEYGNGSSEDFGYEETDPRYRLASIDYAYKCDINSLVENHGGLKFTRDNSGNPLTWGSDEYTKSYEYDENSRLKSANFPGNATENWNYDWVGNRTNTNYAYNSADQLTGTPDKTYTYKNSGDLFQINSGAKTFVYTDNNLVSTVQHNGGATSTMVWDSGNRVSFTSSTGGTYKYLFDESTAIPAVIEEVTPNNSIYYIREPNGALLARVDGTTIQYYHFDELGNTLFMTDTIAVVSDKYTYDAWGNVTSHWGSTNQPYQYVGQLGYYTHYNDANLPYIQTGVRLYNPEVGRYMQRDRIKKGINLYRYASNNTLKNVDFNGLDWTTIDFVFHYLYGSGVAVNLADVGLLDDYQQAKEIAGSTSSWEGAVSTSDLKSKARAKCKNPSYSNKNTIITSVMKSTEDPHVGESELFGEYIANPLFSLGSSTFTMISLCKAVVDCCSHTLKFECDYSYELYDLFSDPFDIGHIFKGHPFDFRKPYEIKAYWETKRNGELSFD